jgi:ribonuclease HI
MKLVIHTDGGARGNPGPAAVGVVIEKVTDATTEIVTEFGKTIGETTNNVAEYTGVIEALKFLKTYSKDISTIDFFLDSTLVVNQLNGLFKIKDSKLRELLSNVRILEQEIGVSVQYAYVPREKNTRADYFVNYALDSHHSCRV